MVAAVIAGLAAGIFFVVIFASIFYSPNPIVQKMYYSDVSIMGLKDTYQAGEKIDFSIRANGYGTVCGAPSASIVDLDDPSKI